MPSLVDVIQRVRNKLTDQSDWLYIAGSADDLTLQTEADLGYPVFDEASDKEIDPVGFMERGLQSTIDIQTVEECIRWADQLAECASDEAALDVIRYYIRFDAWPQTLNSPDPPPREEVVRRLDREFCDTLGPEDSTKNCRRENCDRGVVKFRVFCRRHHFESIKKRPYPFDN